MLTRRWTMLVALGIALASLLIVTASLAEVALTVVPGAIGPVAKQIDNVLDVAKAAENAGDAVKAIENGGMPFMPPRMAAMLSKPSIPVR